MHKSAEGSCTISKGNMATVRARELYNDIAFDYSTIKTNKFKRWVEETTFLDAIVGGGCGDGVRGKSVLDLGCGSGHFCRLIKENSGYGAGNVYGVDVCDAMVEEAKRIEKSAPRGISYYRVDLLGSGGDGAGDTVSDLRVDVCAAAYLLPYASSVEELRKFCSFAARALGSGGRFVSVTTILNKPSFEKAAAAADAPGGVLASDAWGFSIVWEADSVRDGMLADVTLFGSCGRDVATRVTFPNYFWSKDAITGALLDSGFDRVEWLVPLVAADAPGDVANEFGRINRTPALDAVGFFVATKK